MGRQVAFYMTAADEEDLVRFLREREDVAILPDGHERPGFPELSALPAPDSIKGWYILNLVPRSELDEIRYHTISEDRFIINKDESPVVEWMRSMQRGIKLKEGRFWIGGTPVSRTERRVALYEDLVKWLKRHCTKMKRGRFFIGRDAKAWAAGGGELIFGQDPWDYSGSRFRGVDL